MSSLSLLSFFRLILVVVVLMLAAGQTVMVLKYLVKNYPIQTLYFGIANIVSNGLVMMRYVLVLYVHGHVLTMQYGCAMGFAEYGG